MVLEITAKNVEMDMKSRVGPPGPPASTTASLGKKGNDRRNVIDSCMRDYNGSTSFIRTLTGFLTDRERAAFISHAESVGFDRTQQRETRDCAHRQQWRIAFEDSEIAASIFHRVLPYIPEEIDNAKPHSCSTNIRIYRYDVGDSFGCHFDDTISVEIPTRLEDAEVASSQERGKKGSKNKKSMNLRRRLVGWTKLTILIYLNGYDYPVDGGETRFYLGEKGGEIFVSFSPSSSSGDLLMHGHGNRCLLHEAAPVTGGKKYILRTDVVYL